MKFLVTVQSVDGDQTVLVAIYVDNTTGAECEACGRDDLPGFLDNENVFICTKCTFSDESGLISVVPAPC